MAFLMIQPGCRYDVPHDFILLRRLPYGHVELYFAHSRAFLEQDVRTLKLSIPETLKLSVVRIAHVDLSEIDHVMDQCCKAEVHVLVIPPIVLQNRREGTASVLLSELEEKASRWRIIVCMEAEREPTLTELLRLIELECPSNIQIALDMGGLGWGEDRIMDLLAEKAGWLPVLHVSNFDNRGLKGLPLFHPSGLMDYGLVIRVLKDIDYNGYLILDYAPAYRSYYVEDITRIREYVLSPTV